jgi:hypothetical protein
MASTVSEKKRLGVYYTPEPIAELLAQWAIRKSADRMLEPSFGKCGFLTAATRRLETEGNENPLRQIYGFDVDKNAFQGPLEELTSESEAAGNFQREDFLEVTPEELSPEGFDVVIGNPPYVSHHNMERGQRRTAARAIEDSPFTLDRKASLWAYFVLHSLQFLNDGGRIAWVLPGSLFHSDYSQSVVDAITSNFERAVALQLGERVFKNEGAEEHTIILLAEGWKTGEPAETLEVGYVPSLEDLQSRIEDMRNGEWTGEPYHSRIGYVLMEPEVADALQIVRDRCNVVQLGDKANVKIGIVTGDNRFFVISPSTADRHDLAPSDWKYIFAKSKITDGLSLTENDFGVAEEKDYRCLLVTAEGGMSDPLEAYFDRKSSEEVAENVTFGKRDDWKKPDEGEIPDAFFTYMQSLGPRLILNEARVNSTNTIHRVEFEDGMSETEQKALAVSLMSTYSRLSAELEGRTYGAGILKLEIGETSRMRAILPENVSAERVDEVFRQVDTCLRNGQVDEAEEVANRFVFGHLAQPDIVEIVRALKSGLKRARTRRKGE